MPDEIRCQICHLDSNGQPGLQCPACVRAVLYPVRLRQARALMDRRNLDKQTEHVVAGLGDSVKTASSQQFSARARCDQLLADFRMTERQIDIVTRHAETLKKELQEYKDDVKKRKAAHDSRRLRLAKAKTELNREEKRSSTELQEHNKRATRRYEKTYKDIVTSRNYLCKNAASLAGLRQHHSPDPDRKLADYSIAGINIPDLRGLNNVPPDEITTGLTQVSRLLTLCCQYLHVRLPAEITVPRRDWPLPTVSTPSSSYSGLAMQVPLRKSSPKASREVDRRAPGRPRPLYLDRKLPRLAREDPSAYALFVEGVALLAWDIAWLCRTQGLSVATSNWEDVCMIGPNLWNLLVTTPGRSPAVPFRQASDEPKDLAARDAKSLGQHSSFQESIQFGLYSHGTAHNFLGGNGGLQSGSSDAQGRAWAFASPVKIMHELKAYLVHEMSGHDWELLGDDDQFVEVSANTGSPEMVSRTSRSLKGAEKDSEQRLRAQDYTNGLQDGPSTGSLVDGKTKGTSGWTKLKSRNADV